jgi:threonyl-tRNA synthetase
MPPLIFGSLERFFGILTENYAGAFPLWIAPTQVRLLPVTDAVQPYLDETVRKMKAAGIRVEITSGERLAKVGLYKLSNSVPIARKHPSACVISRFSKFAFKFNLYRYTELVRNAEKAKVPIMCVVGEQEAADGTLAVRTYADGDQGVLSVDDVIARVAAANKGKLEKF